MSIELLILTGLQLVIIALLWRGQRGQQKPDEVWQSSLQNLLQQQREELLRLERGLLAQLQQQAQAGRQEMQHNLSGFQQALISQLSTISQLQKGQMDSFAQQLAQLNQANASQLEKIKLILLQQAQQSREELAQNLQRQSQTLGENLQTLTQNNSQALNEVRQTLEQKVTQLQTENAAKLDEMRKVVDEKLHATLEQRLGESFKLVSDRLEKVHQGLGEMQQLAVGVGDLKRVLTNVKTRGTWGEVQLEMVLQQMLTTEQYGKNIETIPGSGERVEFAIKLPGKEAGKAPVWLPIDAKFPKEQYERLLDAAERADAEAVKQASKELERAVRQEARTISEKYLSPPLTTDFAILFLPTEGLYAEVMRYPGLADELQRTYRISIAGPSTLSALLNSLQMGFRTMVLEQRSAEVWQVLGAVKTEFGKFGDVLAQTKTALERAAKNIDQAEVRTRQMSRKLKQVEALPDTEAQNLLGTAVVPADD